MSYWDTSAVVKLFAREADSAAFKSLVTREPQRLVTAELTRLELWSTLRRKEAEGFLNGGEAGVLLSDFDSGCAKSEWKLVPNSADVRGEFERIVEMCCSQTPPIFIRTLDALHIASALVVGETEIVATDRRLRDAATLLGFQLFPTPTP